MSSVLWTLVVIEGYVIAAGFLCEGSVPIRTRELEKEIAERKQAEEAIQRSETKFRSLYDSTDDAVVLADVDGIFDCNAAALRMFGCASSAELCSLQPGEISAPRQPCGSDSNTLSKERMTAALNGARLRFEWVHRRVDNGTTFPAEVLLNALELDGRRVVQGVVRDISERKQADAEIDAANQELLKVSRMAGMSEIATGVLHNVGNVLNSVNVAASVVTERVRKSPASQFRQAGEIVEEYIDDMPRFVSEHPQGKHLGR